MQLWENKITPVFRDIKAVSSTQVIKEQTVKSSKGQEQPEDTTELYLLPFPAAQHRPLAGPSKRQWWEHNWGFFCSERWLSTLLYIYSEY